MDLALFKQGLTPTFNKDDLLEEMAALQSAIPTLSSLVRQLELPSNSKFSAEKTMLLQRIQALFRNIPTNVPFTQSVTTGLGRAAINIDHINTYISDKFPETLVTANCSIKQLHAIWYLSQLGKIRQYLPELIVESLRSIGSTLSDHEAYEPNRRLDKYLADNAFSFAVALDTLSMDKDKFTKVFDMATEVEATDSNLKMSNTLSDYHDPALRQTNGFIGNPIFSLRKWLNTLTVQRVRYLEDKLVQAKMFREELGKELAGGGSPAIVKELMLLDDEVADLEYRIARAER